MNIEINLLEVAAELADREAKIMYGESRFVQDVYSDDLKYTEKAQEHFNTYYDIYYHTILELKLPKNEQQADKKTSIIRTT